MPECPGEFQTARRDSRLHAGGAQDDAELRYLLEGAFQYDGKTWNEGAYMFLPNGAAVGDLGSPGGATFDQSADGIAEQRPYGRTCPR